ncbi:MAG: glutathione S-transferase family protein [Myxococcales bacterium]|nr:glutathione S-transferase family protein [Myxococcales bacterium]
MSLTLYGSPYSTFTWSARLALAEKGVAYTLAAAKLGSPEYGALHPYRKMPVLDHDGFVVFEAAAVMNYVDEAFEGPALKPADARGRARMWQWSGAVSDYVAPAAVRGVLVPRLVLAPRGLAVDDAAVQAAAVKATGHLGPFEAALGTSLFLAGDSPTFADFLLLPIIATGRALSEPDRYTDGLPNIDEWFGRMGERPSFSACLPGGS